MGNTSSQRKNGRAHTKKVASEILDEWSIYWMWVLGPTGHHKAGRAIDFMTLTNDQRKLRNKVGNEIAAYLRKHHKRLGVEYIIWRRRIWNATRTDDNPRRTGWSSWRLMEDRGSTTANHMDHVHVSLRNRPPSYKPGKQGGTARAKPTRRVSVSAIVAAAQSDPKRRQGGTTRGAASDVKLVEDALRREGFLSKTYATDGSFGTLTVRAYGRWQRRLGYRGKDADGIPGKASLTKLGNKYGFEVIP